MSILIKAESITDFRQIMEIHNSDIRIGNYDIEIVPHYVNDLTFEEQMILLKCCRSPAFFIGGHTIYEDVMLEILQGKSKCKNKEYLKYRGVDGLAISSNITPRISELLSKHPEEKVRVTLAGNPSCSLKALDFLSYQKDKRIAERLANNPSTPPSSLNRVFIGNNPNSDLLKELRGRILSEKLLSRPDIDSVLIETIFRFTETSIKAGPKSKLTDLFLTHPNTPNEIIEKIKKKQSKCFVATAVYGNSEGLELDIFRDYRDTILSKSFFGRQFIILYYLVSPPLADFISMKPVLRRKIKRYILEPLLNLFKKRLGYSK